MPTFHLTDQGGATYEVEAPNEYAAVTALGQMSKGAGGAPADQRSAAPSPEAATSAPKDEVASYDAMGNPTGSTEAASPASEMPYADQMAHVGKTVDNVVRTLANGVPFMDRIAAAGGAATGIGGTFGDYSGNLERERGRDRAIEESAPVASKIGSAIGGAAAAGAVLPASAFGLGGSVASKVLRSGATGGGIGAASAVSDAPDLTDLADVKDRAKSGLGQGAVFGAAIPALGATAGAAYRTAAPFLASSSDGMNRVTRGLLANAVRGDASQRLAELGPEAMLLDTSPSALGLAQGTAAKPGPGQDALVNALLNRHEGQSNRIVGSLDDNLGPAISPTQIAADMGRRMDKTSPLYKGALDEAPAVDINPLVKALNNWIPQSEGMEKKALGTLKDSLMMPNPEYEAQQKKLAGAVMGEGVSAGVPTGNFIMGADEYRQLAGLEPRSSAPQIQPYFPGPASTPGPKVPDIPAMIPKDMAVNLHKIKGEMDNVINYDAPGLGVPAAALSRQQGALKQFRGQLNDAIETQVPGYADANLAFHTAAKGLESYKAGQQALATGKTAVWPEDLAAEFGARPLEQQALMRHGARADIAVQMGTRPNDLAALNKVVGGENDFNRPKMATMFGDIPTQRVIDTLRGEQKFADSYNKIAQGSQSAQRLAGSQAIDDASNRLDFTIPKNATLMGLLGHAGEAAVRGGFNMASRAAGERTREQLANLLSSRGVSADTTAESLAEALKKYDTNAGTIRNAISNPLAMAAALRASSGDNRSARQ